MTKQLLQPVTPKVLSEVHALVSNARHACLALIEIQTGHPAISRVALASNADGTPILLTSELAPHTAALRADGRCSLLIGEIGKGDPMAHPRLTMFCLAEQMPKEQNQQIRTKFLTHHPKAINYIDLPDFGFWQLSVLRLSYNAGFGRAFAIKGDQFTSV